MSQVKQLKASLKSMWFVAFDKDLKCRDYS